MVIFLKLYITFSKRTLAIILAILIIFIIFTSQIVSANLKKIDGSTHSKRMAYLQSLGISVDESSQTSKDIVIPEVFSDVYNNYNKLQKKAGFNLADYKGKEATVYTYPIDDELDLHLIVCNGIIIGGDIASRRIDGEMRPLAI